MSIELKPLLVFNLNEIILYPTAPSAHQTNTNNLSTWLCIAIILMANINQPKKAALSVFQLSRNKAAKDCSVMS